MDKMVITTIIATVISTVVATLVSIFLNREKKRERFDLQLEGIITHSIKYPYLENKLFAENWEQSLIEKDERYQRYETYCAIVFNFLYDICEWKKYNLKKIEEYIGIKYWLRKHEKCWKYPSSSYVNTDIYGEKFTNLVKTYIP
ncbi:MAG: hypothetical protein LBH44_03130 [Treponema sp.]|jgi:hypothetical protein|nr:hypothetical protein [Treponema sp.]